MPALPRVGDGGEIKSLSPTPRPALGTNCGRAELWVMKNSLTPSSVVNPYGLHMAITCTMTSAAPFADSYSTGG